MELTAKRVIVSIILLFLTLALKIRHIASLLALQGDREVQETPASEFQCSLLFYIQIVVVGAEQVAHSGTTGNLSRGDCLPLTCSYNALNQSELYAHTDTHSRDTQILLDIFLR